MVLTYYVGVLCASKELLHVELDTLLFVKQAVRYIVYLSATRPQCWACTYVGVFLCLVIIIIDVADGELATILFCW